MLAELVSLSNSQHDEIRQFSAYSLAKMSTNSDVRSIVVSNGGLEPVLYLARTNSHDIQREVVPALCCLSFDRFSKVRRRTHSGQHPWLTLCSSLACGVQISFTRAHSHIAIDRLRLLSSAACPRSCRR